MARRIFESLKCLPYSTELARRPQVSGELKTIDGESVFASRPLPVDSGFAGHLLVPNDMFAPLQKFELPESESNVYRTLVGSVPMRTARGTLQITDHDEMEALVETPRYGGGKLLLGLEALKSFRILLDGPRMESCTVTERT